MLVVPFDSLASQAGEQCDTDTCYLNNKPKLDNLTLQPAFHVSASVVMSLACLFSPGSFMRTFSISPTCCAARLVRSVLCSGLGGAGGARAMPPHVHPGWKVRTLRTECSGLLERRAACSVLHAWAWPGVVDGRWGWGQEYVRPNKPMIKESLYNGGQIQMSQL